MIRLIWILLVVMILFSCKEQNIKEVADQHKLTLLISKESVIAYNGKFSKRMPYKRYLINEPEKLREAIEQNRLKYGFQSEIIIKIAFESEDAFSFHLGEHLQNLKDIAKQNSGPDFKLVDVTEAEEKFFKILPFKWSFMDSFYKPSTLELNMPKDEKDENQPVQDKNSINCVLLPGSEIYCYAGFNIEDGKLYSLEGKNTFKAFITKAYTNNKKVLLKPLDDASYANLVDLLDEMTLNKITNYVIAKVSEKEKAFFSHSEFNPKLSTLSDIQPSPYTVIQKLPDINVMLIKIGKDRSVLCKTFNEAGEHQVSVISLPVPVNLRKAVEKYEGTNRNPDKKYFILGDKDTDYETFRQVVEGLRQKSIFNYKLVITDNW